MEMTNTILQGNSLEVLKTLEANSVDSIVTDPPYGLSFMGKKWDYDVPSKELWVEAMRVLKPGGHLLSFAGSRTYHRMAVNIEDAGFEIRDQIMWVYGCLSEDTEVLTSNGWERFHKDTKYGKIMVYDIQKDIYKWEEPEGWQSYQINKDTAYRIQSDYTDQIVSRNHRCLVEREGKLTFVQAEELSEMELMPTLSNDFYRVHKLQSKVLLKTMQRVLSWTGLEEVGKDRERNSKPTRTQSKEGSLGCGQSCVERGSNLFQEKGKLRKIQNKVFTLSERILSYGKERQLCYGTQTDSGSISQSLLGKSRGSSSHQSQPRGQSVGESDVVSVKQGSQVTRMARVTKIEYTGLIFCPTVSTGAFVARRNGKIFITGNSGFPKSHNIGKAVDKLQGNEREVVGTQKLGGNAAQSTKEKGGTYASNTNSIGIEPIDVNLTKGSSPYEGWGTALKPSHEPIVVARKPLSESTIAENVLAWGTGGINIDGCRVEAQKGDEPKYNNANGVFKNAGNGTEQEKYVMQNYEKTFPSTQGRFPANFIHDGSDEVVGLFPDTGKSKASKRGADRNGDVYGTYGLHDTLRGHNDNGGSASRFFKVCEQNEVSVNANSVHTIFSKFMEQSKSEHASFAYFPKASKKDRNEGCEELEKKAGGSNAKGYTEDVAKGVDRNRPVANFHPTVKPTSLMQYLVRLVTPKGGTVLDPFTGSGSTGKACVLEGFDFIGIELDPEYCKIAEARINVKTF